MVEHISAGKVGEAAQSVIILALKQEVADQTHFRVPCLKDHIMVASSSRSSNRVTVVAVSVASKSPTRCSLLVASRRLDQRNAD